ncbi:MAG: NADH-quinone oxidoreductase subunit NuoF [Armatimonadetes bacterium]|nr:NADH-quinone oxidoreductase subunit NuoF [Armatimonadota bacterium]
MLGQITSPNELARAREELAAASGREITLRVCSTGCRAQGALEVCDALEHEIASRGLDGKARVARVGCHGLCAGAVTAVVEPSGTFYQGVAPEDAQEIVETTVANGQVLDRLCWSSNGNSATQRAGIPFFSHQTRLILKNCGVIDPTSLEDCIAQGGYAACARALTEMSPEGVVEEVINSGLRGRGGAGFPTGRKWQLTRAAAGSPKYIVCNADEGDPGAFMDRAVLEGDPHLVIEGMIIGAYAIGSNKGFIYARAEYPIAIEHTEIALREARAAGLLGKNILGSGFDFDIEIRKGAGAFVCGEETSLIASLEGKRGMPRPRPPFPANAGYAEKPTNINNVETWANVPRIIEIGAEAYSAIGTEGSKGTKIFALAGKVNNTGLVEVPMGATLREIIYDIGGGIPRGRKFKAAQMGGPSGGCVPARYLDLKIDYDSVKDVGAIMGSGGLIVMDEGTCMVDIARFFTDFVQKESCGKCVPCRVGTKRMLEILTRITEGEGELEDIDRLEKLGEMIKQTSLCGLGQTAPNPVLSTIRYFRDEYEAHIVEKRCPAHSCEKLITTTCSSACPAHVNIPEYVGLIAAGRFDEALDIIRRRNPLASVCGRACDHPCEMFCRRGDVDEPVAVRHLKRFVTQYAKHGSEPPKWVGPREGKVAVIGSGPAGLSAAYFLALMGREVKVFEALDVLGGLLAVGIPEYRLPRKVLNRDIDYIRSAGVEMETGHRVESLQELRDAGYDAVFVGVGAHGPVLMKAHGEDLPGVQDSLAFLRKVSLGEIDEITGKVVVIGGGNAAIDAARTAIRLGADSVTVLYRRTREEMPAIPAEIEDALDEGVDIRYLVAPEKIEGDGRVQAVRCVEMELGPADESGRRRPMPKPGSETVVEADHVIVAIGQSPELDFAASDGQLVVSYGRVFVNPVTHRSGNGDVFAGGDAVTGSSTIIEAVAAGQRAARAIDIYLGGKGELPPDRGFAPSEKPTEEDAAAPRQAIRTLPPEERIRTFEEVVHDYTAEVACREARRCLRCDLEE